VSSSPAAGSAPKNELESTWSWPARPFKNPSYPDRVHFPERPELEARLKACDEKVAAAGKKLALLTNHPKRAEYEKIHHQMRGARDQIAEAVYRMPRESGELYREDHEKLVIAEQAFTWLAARWESVAH